MPKYMFDVWTEIHGTVEIEADTNDQAWELLGEQMYDAELTEEYTDREAVLVHVEEE